MSVTDQIGIT